MNILRGITRIQAVCSFSISDTGEIVADSESVEQEGGCLKIGCGDSGDSTIVTGGSMTIGNGSIIAGGSTSMKINGVSVRTTGNKFILQGPPDRILVVNGVQTTFGSIVAGSVVAQVLRKKYYLHEDTRINNLATTGYVRAWIAGKFLSATFHVGVSGSGKVSLPERSFDHLSLNIAGSGDIVAAKGTTAVVLNATISGSGDISGVSVLDSGVASIAGCGDIKIYAINPSNIIRSCAGSGEISVKKARDVQPPVTAASSESKKRSFSGEANTGKSSRKEE
jgi:hypothetical protein